MLSLDNRQQQRREMIQFVLFLLLLAFVVTRLCAVLSFSISAIKNTSQLTLWTSFTFGTQADQA